MDLEVAWPGSTVYRTVTRQTWVAGAASGTGRDGLVLGHLDLAAPVPAGHRLSPPGVVLVTEAEVTVSPVRT
ncbi:hypothetical protein GCM10020229_21360 [Kitasatospora albolonga]